MSFAALAELPAGLAVSADRLFEAQRNQLINLADRYAIPTIYYVREFVTAGGLASYGSDFADAYRQVGVYTGRILNAAKPAELPVLQSTRIELVINAKTAKALGITIPQSLLLGADEVIQ